MKFTTDAKVLDRNITTWHKSKSAMVDKLNVLVASCICTAIEGRNCAQLNRLDIAMHDGLDNRGKTASAMHLSGFRSYVIDHAPVTWARRDKKTGKNEHFTFSEDKWAKMSDLYKKDAKKFQQKLLDTPFWKVKSQPEFEGISIPRAVHALVNRIKNMMKDEAKKDHPKNDMRGLKEIEALASRFAPQEAKAASA